MIQFVKKKIHNLISDQKFSEILSGSVWALSARIIATILGFVFSIIVARFYGAEMVGILAVINSFIMLVTIFTVLGTNTSILRLIPEHLAKYSPSSAFRVYRKTQYMVIGISIITTSVFFLSANLIADKIFSKPHLSYYFALASVFVVFKSIMDLNMQAVRGLRLIKVFAVMQFLPQIFNLLILICIGLFWSTIEAPIYSVLSGFVMTGITGSIIINQTFKKIVKRSDTIYPMSCRDILSISLPMLMASTMVFVIGQTGVIMIGIFRNEAEVGVYAIAVKLATLTTFILQAINSMVGPKFSQLYHSNKIDELFYLAKKSAKLIFWSTAPILFVLVAFGKLILNNAFGHEFISGYPALVLLVAGHFIHSVSGATSLFMNMTGNQILLRNIVFIAALINILINISLTPKYGIYGAAIAAMVSVSSWNITTLVYMKLKYGKTTGYFPLF